jgi:hypothetical protein
MRCVRVGCATRQALESCIPGCVANALHGTCSAWIWAVQSRWHLIAPASLSVVSAPIRCVLIVSRAVACCARTCWLKLRACCVLHSGIVSSIQPGFALAMCSVPAALLSGVITRGRRARVAAAAAAASRALSVAAPDCLKGIIRPSWATLVPPSLTLVLLCALATSSRALWAVGVLGATPGMSRRVDNARMTGCPAGVVICCASP